MTKTTEEGKRQKKEKEESHHKVEEKAGAKAIQGSVIIAMK